MVISIGLSMNGSSLIFGIINMPIKIFDVLLVIYNDGISIGHHTNEKQIMALFTSNWLVKRKLIVFFSKRKLQHKGNIKKMCDL